MDLTDRQREILGLIRANGRVDVDGLATQFAITTQTIRRDLAELCDRGLAVRTHGGARRLLSVSNVDYQARRKLNIDAKARIGAVAATLISDHCSVALNIGTTTEQVGLALGQHSGLTILSNNVNIISSFVGAAVRDLILVGGSVRHTDGAVVGEDAVEFISRYKLDYAIIGASSLDDDGAILDYDAREVSVARAILRNARTKILVCDHSKFDHGAPVRICAVADIDYFITDASPPAKFAKIAEAGDVKIMVAEA